MATITTTTPPENLTGWTVTVPAVWSSDASYGDFSIIGVLDGFFEFTNLALGYSYRLGNLYGVGGTCVAYSDPIVDNHSVIDGTTSFTFTVTGGNDVTTSSLIQWLVDNNATFSKEEEGPQVDKTNNLPAFLKDLYEGIITKKPDASKNPQNFRSEIEAIQTGETIEEWDGTGVVIEAIEEESTDATVTITNTSGSYDVNVGTSYSVTATNDIGTIGFNETKVFTIPKGTTIYIGSISGIIPGWSTSSISGDIEDVTPGFTGGFVINGDGTITGYGYDAD